MRSKKVWSGLVKTIVCLVLFNISNVSFGQETVITKSAVNFRTVATITTKGISTIPNFSLGKPAAMFELGMGSRLTFEPQFRFALAGKPWSFTFWWRYKLITKEKFQFNIGAHPAIAFRTKTFVVDGIPRETIVAQRYLASEIAPSYLISKKISVGLYWLYSHGFEKDATRNNNFISFRTNFSDIRLTKQFYLKFNPQIYYLKMDNDDGIYFNSSLTLAKRNFPVAIATQVNKPIKTNIVVGNEFLWNVSLVYTFNKNYVEK